MEDSGTTKETAIELEDVTGSNSGIIVATVSEEDKDRAVDKQNKVLQQCNEDMHKKKAATVSPSEATKEAGTVSASVDVHNLCSALGASGDKLSIYGFAREGKESPKILPIYEAKVIKKRSLEEKDADLRFTLDTMEYVTCNDDPLRQRISGNIHFSDVLLLNVKEIEEEETEPVYIVFYDVESKPGPGREDEGDTMSCNCDECFYDACCEYLFGVYCVAAARRYFEENSYIATERDAYAVFVAHFNRRLDLHSFENSDAERLRPTEVSLPPKCMREGSLTHSIRWIKWQIRHGPHSEWYADQRRKKARAKIAKKAKEQNERRNGYLL